MRLPRSNSILTTLFIGGIIVPTVILSVLSFRNIQNEAYLTEKNFEDNLANFQKEVGGAAKQAQDRILHETKNASQFLYEQPHKFSDFGKTESVKNVDGISAIFLFNGSRIIYPGLSFSSIGLSAKLPRTRATPMEAEIFTAERGGAHPRKVYAARSLRLFGQTSNSDEYIQNLLGLLRFHYTHKNFAEALRIIEYLEKHPGVQGYLHKDLSPSLRMMRFDILVAEGHQDAAEDYCMQVFADFLESHEISDIDAAQFFFDNAVSQILSFENLDRDKRESFWNLRENLNRQLSHLEILTRHRAFFNRLVVNYGASKEGILYQQDNQDMFLRMSYPWLSGDQVVIGVIDREHYRARILAKIIEAAKEWKDIRYTVTDASDSLLTGTPPDSAANIAAQRTLGEGMGWTLTVYQRNSQELHRETRKKTFILYGLVLCSLLTVLFGSLFVFRSLTQERRLLSMKANFLSSVSHELKTPLTSIKMFAEMMAKGRVQKMDKIQEYSGLIGKESTRLENLIGAILSYTRMERGSQAFHWERIDMAQCAEKVYNALLHIADDRGIKMDLEIERGNFVMGDYTSLYSLAQNLIENAIKYTNPPGHVTVRVKNELDKVVFSVTDTGIGIASSEQKNIFNDFYRVGDEMTRRTKGSGLGLAIVKRVAEAHKADVSVQSKPGKGSTFTVRLRKAE